MYNKTQFPDSYFKPLTLAASSLTAENKGKNRTIGSLRNRENSRNSYDNLTLCH